MCRNINLDSELICIVINICHGAVYKWGKWFSMKKAKNISRLWHIYLSNGRSLSGRPSDEWRLLKSKTNIALLIRDVGIHPDNHLKCYVFTAAYDSGSPDSFPKPVVQIWVEWVGGVYELVGYDNVLHEDDTKIIKPS